MIEREIIVVGAGPAGSSCAWQLHQAGREVLVLDQHTFPRVKLCAGWVTPRVWNMLGVQPSDYPHSLIRLNRLIYHIHGRRMPLPTRQYSIRRYEFDHWLLKRSGAEFRQHKVQSIRSENGYYIIDDTYRCKYLVGAGGTNCPVYRTLFRPRNPREEAKRISTMELEFPYQYSDSSCYLWFFDHDLPGYSWYVPKGNNHLNIGIGGKFQDLRARGQTIRQHWEWFVEKLRRLRLVENIPTPVKGYNYYLRQRLPMPQIGNAFLVGDAAGLATIDMGEGIGPAIHSGLLAARAILNGELYSPRKIPRYSLWDLLFWWR